MHMELVAPAGSMEKLKFALAFGADAVYAGVPRFSLRARENQFSAEELDEAIRFTHHQGKKIFLTLNIFPHNRKLASFERALYQMRELQPDAIILSDPGVIAMAREICPDLSIHLSTQANTVNWRSVSFWQDLGVKRIILSRELSIEEIAEIRAKNPDIELEAFVHGAICVAYSGRCLLSNYFTHRDPNQGTCANSCRWKYRVYEDGNSGRELDGNYFIEEEDRPGEMMPIDEDEFGTYIMNSKDMCAIGILDRMADAGIDSFKIEGRTKSVYYLSIISRAYRLAIDALKAGQPVPEDLIQEVWTVANRDYITGFLDKNDTGSPVNLKHSHSQKHTRIFCGILAPGENEQTARVKVRNRFEIGDDMELITAEKVIPFRLDRMLDLEGKVLEIAHGGGQDVVIPVPEKIVEYTLLRKKLQG